MLERFAQGSTFKEIRPPTLLRFLLRLPPLSEQRCIAKILDTLDETIRNTEQVIKKLEAMKQGLLHDLLTRGINENGEVRNPVRHPEQFKHSAIGQIPRVWEARSVMELLAPDEPALRSGPFGSALRKDELVEEGVQSADNAVGWDFTMPLPRLNSGVAIAKLDHSCLRR